MPRFILTLAAALVIGALAMPAGPAAAANTLHFTTEQYPPFNFHRDGEIVGLGPDQAREIMRRTGIPFDMELLPWSRAIGLARSRPMTCVLTTAHTVDRNPHFKWVEPLLVERTLIIRATNSNVHPANLAEARAYRTGTQTGDYTVELLHNAGFTNLDLARDFDLTLKKLLSGRVDLIAVSESYAQRLIDQGVPIEEVAVLYEQVFSIACSLETPDDYVKRMQAALKAMIDDGTQTQILAHYN